MNPGDTWVGSKRADFNYFIEQDDPNNPRSRDAVWLGRQCVAFWIYNEDLGPNATPPGDDKHPRTQAEPSRFLERGGHYIIDHYTYIARKNLPTWDGGWLNLWEKYGEPHGGPPPLAWSTHDGETFAFYRGEDPWDTIYQAPITCDQWDQATFDFVNDDPGPLTVSHNGVPVFHDPAFRCVNDSDQDGPWATIPHLYMERDGVVPDGQRIGPVWMYDVVRQVA